MKQFLLIASAIMTTALTLNAQWTIGPRISMGVIAQGEESFRILPNSEHGIYDLSYVGSTSVQSAGLMIYRKLGPFFVQTEIMATRYSLEYQMDRYKSLTESSPLYAENHYIVELPLIAGYSPGKFKIGLGPVAEIYADKESQFSVMGYYQDTSDKVEYGFQGLVGYKLGIMHIDLKYVNKFNSIADGFNFGEDDMKLKKSANRIMLSIGVAF